MPNGANSRANCPFVNGKRSGHGGSSLSAMTWTIVSWIDDPSARVQTWIEYGREVEHPDCCLQVGVPRVRRPPVGRDPSSRHRQLRQWPDADARYPVPDHEAFPVGAW